MKEPSKILNKSIKFEKEQDKKPRPNVPLEQRQKILVGKLLVVKRDDMLLSKVQSVERNLKRSSRRTFWMLPTEG